MIKQDPKPDAKGIVEDIVQFAQALSRDQLRQLDQAGKGAAPEQCEFPALSQGRQQISHRQQHENIHNNIGKERILPLKQGGVRPEQPQFIPPAGSSRAGQNRKGIDKQHIQKQDTADPFPLSRQGLVTQPEPDGHSQSNGCHRPERIQG